MTQIQLELPICPAPSWQERTIGRLLWLANQQPLPRDPERFYRLKARLLERHGHRTGTAWQEIVKSCWSCHGTGGLYEPGGCWKCGGTGEFSRVYHRLERWRCGDRDFLVPVETVTEPPPRVDIRGRVEHPDRGPSAIEAGLWLVLLFDRGLFWQCLRETPYWCGRMDVTIREAGFCPLLQCCRLFQWAAAPARWWQFWSDRRCLTCDRRLWPAGNHWQCRRCLDSNTEPPF